ncbi:MAG TPA: glycosyltransferase family 2 protein [Acidobacteriaceae bacterium]|nr:glycosyltransferase family 2 protein [Acidobacteriaceae bacterium]
MNAHSPRVCCVVINWNGWRDTVACVQSLTAQDYPDLKILVVDNASTDDSLERIGAVSPGIPLLRAEENRGFAAGSNLGIGCALKHGADFVWLLNNDILAPEDTLKKLVAAASDPSVGIVGSVLHYLDHPDRIQAWGGGSIVPWMGYARHFDAPAELDGRSFLTFASVLLRREMLEQVGLLDDRYFMYFEDSDLCFRARSAGWKLAIAADTAVLHKEGGSCPSKKSTRLDRIVTASGLRFLDRYGRPRSVAKGLFVASRLAKRAVRGNLRGMRAVWRGVGDWRRDDPTAFQESE